MIKQGPSREQTGNTQGTNREQTGNKQGETVLKLTDRQTLQSAVMGKLSSAVMGKQLSAVISKLS